MFSFCRTVQNPRRQSNRLEAMSLNPQTCPQRVAAVGASVDGSYLRADGLVQKELCLGRQQLQGTVPSTHYAHWRVYRTVSLALSGAS